jgi:hypothetical protein
MNIELETRLTELYPSLFRGKDMLITENLMSFGCECSDGWFNIIKSACAVISAHEKRDGRTDFLFTQIKEKYGTLRIYSEGADEFVIGVIAMAEDMSAVTCELCGSPGKLRDGGWLTTRCDNCHPKDN